MQGHRSECVHGRAARAMGRPRRHAVAQGAVSPQPAPLLVGRSYQGMRGQLQISGSPPLRSQRLLRMSCYLVTSSPRCIGDRLSSVQLSHRALNRPRVLITPSGILANGDAGFAGLAGRCTGTSSAAGCLPTGARAGTFRTCPPCALPARSRRTVKPVAREHALCTTALLVQCLNGQTAFVATI